MKTASIKLVFLGTGAGIITRNRKESGILIKQKDGRNILIDPGSAIMERLLRINLGCDDIDFILITHLHPDHVQGIISFLFSANYQFASRRKELMIIAPFGFKDFYKKIIEAFGHTITPQTYKAKIIEVKNQCLNFNDFKIVAKKTLHTKESVGYRLEFRKKVITYSGDTDYCKEIISLSKKSDILILESSFPDEIKVKNHLTPRLAGKIAKESKVKRLILTHFFPICDRYDIIKEAKKVFKGKTAKAYDFLELV